MFVQMSRRAVAMFCLAVAMAIPAEAQGPLAITGPDTPGADYSYLSLVIPVATAQGTTFELRYDVCNQRAGNMSFAWDDVGFATDFSDPVGAGLCATYELLNQPAYRRQPSSTIRFSASSKPASAYLTCRSSCDSGPIAFIREGVAKLTAFVGGRALNAPTANNVRPLRLVVRTRVDAANAKQVRVNWAAPQPVRFLVLFPDAKLTIDTLKQFVKGSTGGTIEFNTFPSLEKTPELIVPNATTGVSVSPEKKDFGEWTLDLSPKADAGRVTILILQAGARVARLDAYIPSPPGTANVQ